MYIKHNLARPKVAIDAHMVGKRETGNETYVVQLSSALARLGGYDYRLYTPNPELLPEEIRSQAGLTVTTFRELPSFVRIPLLYPRLVRKEHVSLLHMTYIAPPYSPCPVVVSVHDVTFRLFPHFFPFRVRLLLNLLAGPSIRRANRIIAISESGKRDIVRHFRVSPAKIVVTPLAAGPQYKPQPQSEIRRVQARYGLSAQYVLAVGNVQPRKNLPRLIEAFGALAQETPNLQLAVAGRSTWRGSEVDALIDRMALRERVRFLGYVPDDDLPALYSGATVFCYPSLYEGFGLPPLEAMQCGTPTITSNVSSLPEVVGDAALTVDPTSVSQIATSLRHFVMDEAARHEYSRRGLERAAQFTWERTARLTRDVYSTLLSKET